MLQAIKIRTAGGLGVGIVDHALGADSCQEELGPVTVCLSEETSCLIQGGNVNFL